MTRETLVKEDCGDFQVVSPEYYRDPEDDEIVDDIIVGVDVPTHQLTLHMVKPEQRWCSCGAWQDCMIPCRHAMAVYRLHKGNDLTFIQSELVGDYHKFGYVQKTLKQNIYPVSTESLKSDGTTLPPIIKKRGAGRPKTKRIRNRSEYRMGKDSPIICSKCRCRGHNKRTCPNPPMPTERLLPEEKAARRVKNNEEDEHTSEEEQYEDALDALDAPEEESKTEESKTEDNNDTMDDNMEEETQEDDGDD